MINGHDQTEFYSKVYDKLYFVGYHADANYSHAYPLIEWMLRELKFETVLDVGASVGAAVRVLQAKGKEAIGLDTSLVAVNKAQDCERRVLWGEATRLPFADNDYNVVMSTDVFEHLPPEDVAQAVSEAKRVASRYIAMKICPTAEESGWGQVVGIDNLHLTVEPIHWWMEQFIDDNWKVIFSQDDTFVLQFKKEKADVTDP